MRIFVLLLLFIALSFSIFAQRKKWDPIYLLILSPNQITYDRSLEKEINRENQELNKLKRAQNDKFKEELGSDEVKNKPLYYRERVENEIQYFRNIDFFKMAGVLADASLWMVLMTNDSSNILRFKDVRIDKSLPAFSQLAEDEKKQYVLNFSRIEIRKKEDTIITTIETQFYDHSTRKFLIDSLFMSNQYEIIEGFHIEDNIIEAKNVIQQSFYNALSKSLGKIICSLNCYWMAAENSLENARRKVLENEYYTKPFDKEVLRKVLPENDTTIDINIAYQCFFNQDSTKFIAFFLQELTDSISIAHIGLQPGLILLRIGFFEISGVKYKGKWYYNGLDRVNQGGIGHNSLEQSKKDHFNTLQGWKFDFFKEESTDFNPAFWETKFFSKITGEFVPRGDEPSYDEKTERNLLHYKGLHYVVAKQLREERKSADKIMQEELLKKCMSPLMQKLQLDTSSKCSLIYSTEKKVFIYPIKDKKKIIRYFVFVNSGDDDYKPYEWKYLPSKKSKIYLWQYEVEWEIEKITSWSWRLDYLEDENFWNNYVLFKQGNSYKYLVPIK